MKSQSRSSESGQAIILIVLAIVVLLGLTALAIDGSMLYSDRRLAQSAADSASLAGGRLAAAALEDTTIDYYNWTASPPKCTGQVEAAAKLGRDGSVRRAQDNNFTIDQTFSDGMGVQTSCGIYEVWAAKKSGGKVKVFNDKYMDIETKITQQTDTAFAHFVYGGDLVNTVSAVTRVHPRRPLAYAYAIIALNEAGCKGNTNGVQFRGSSAVKVTNGGVWSNGCLDVDGNPSVTISNGKVTYFDTPKSEADVTSKITMSSGTPVMLKDASDRIPEEYYEISEPNCDGHHISASDLVNYYANHGGPLPSGLYCVDGDVKLTNKKDRLEGVGVTLYVTGDLDLTGGTVILKAPPKNYVGDAIPSLLIYGPKSNQNSWKINGNANFFISGTILAPGVTLDLVGSSLANAYQSQIIVNNVNIGGNNDTAVLYCDCRNASLPTEIDLQR